MNDRDAYIALNMMEKVGPVRVRALVEALGSAGAIFSADKADMVRVPGVGEEFARAIVEQRETVDVDAEIAGAAQSGARIIALTDEEYPSSLREIHDPPLALYVQGELTKADEHALAVVGTRRPTHYGRAVAERFAAGLTQAGYTVVSGLAEGIDTVAHHAALKAKGRTLAVLGGGLDCLYPRSNAALAESIAKRGAVMSEFPLGRQPDRTTFPMRNRIVSGLSVGVLVIEAGMKSGALITARQAMEQGRNVFAAPGRIDSRASQGCHALIRDGAALVTCVEDVLQEYEFLLKPVRRDGSGEPGRPRRPALSEDEGVLVAALEGGEQDVDTLIRGTGLTPSRVGSLLLSLEMKRVVRMLPGRVVELAR